MDPISYEQRRVLKLIARKPYSTPKDCRTGIRTFLALSRRHLIQVSTTLSSVVFPHTSAEAQITDEGRKILEARNKAQGE